MSGEERQTAVITGTSSGIGKLLAVRMASAGYRVIAAMRNTGARDSLDDAVRQAGVSGSIEVEALDVTDTERAETLVADIIRRRGRIDVLVNNAGYAEPGVVEELSDEQWRRQFNTNLFGMIALTRAVIPHMRENHRGAIVNMGSVSGRIGFPGLSAYSASKFAVEGFSEALRLEMLPFQVRVILIEPGAFRTNIWYKPHPAAPDHSPYHGMYKVLQRQVKKTIARAQDPGIVVDTVMKAIAEKSPKLRYPVGKGVKRDLLLKALLPASWIEKAVARMFSS